jgi:3'-phosphoadenosine 5'-phosphosulfate sulfotransferase (PAPS reductase)/FAD synthetase
MSRTPADAQRVQQVWSYGGGRQSVALAVLVRDGKLPKPEAVVFADTGREDSATMAYHREHVAPWLDVQVAGHDLATVDLYGKNGDLLIPAFTESGKLPTFCSTEWKRRVVHRWLRAHGYGPSKPVTMWLGISLDEFSRAHDSPNKWVTHSYPLIDLRLNRADCERIIADAGLPPAPKSSCWMCPFRSREQWTDLRDNRPGDWRLAVELDTAIRERHPGTYLHRDRLPLAEAADLPTKEQETECQTAFCFV